MKTIGIGILLTVMVLGLLPFALIARSRASQSSALPVHLVMDMDKQPKFKAQRATEMFADNRSMRPQVAGTVAREDLMIAGETLDDRMGTRPMGLAGGVESMMFDGPETYAAVVWGRIRKAGTSDEDFAKITAPDKTDADVAGDTTYYVKRVPAVFVVNEDLMRRGQERFVIYCAPCHGETGSGNGPVAIRAKSLVTTPDAVNGWVDPQNLLEAKIGARPDGHIFNTITNGVRNMPSYDKQISIPDRWAIVAYVRALQRSQNAQPADAAAAANP